MMERRIKSGPKKVWRLRDVKCYVIFRLMGGRMGGEPANPRLGYAPDFKNGKNIYIVADPSDFSCHVVFFLRQHFRFFIILNFQELFFY
jgi:hypothetical protein